MDEATKYLVGQGVLGVVCIILLVALRTIFMRLMESQEKRIAEGREGVAAVERNTSALTALTEVIKASRG